MLKNLLVHVPSERSVRPIADSAISLAISRAAHLDAVSIGFETTNMGFAVGGGATLAALEIDYESAVAQTNAALTIFENEARNAGIAYGRHLITGIPVDVAEGAAGNLAQLLRFDHRATALSRTATPSTTTFRGQFCFSLAARYFLFHICIKCPFEARHIGIAFWDGSRLAARTVRDAVPFLARAQAITILSLNDADLSSEVSAAVLVAHLARRGLIARVERMEADRADIQPTILSLAADTGLDLIVMGGYGHSRLNERILGGVTRGMLQSMTVPTLMSH